MIQVTVKATGEKVNFETIKDAELAIKAMVVVNNMKATTFGWKRDNKRNYLIKEI